MNFFNEYKQNPKKRAKTKIIGYGIFFFFVFLLFCFGKDTNYVYDDVEPKNIDSVNSYEYSYKINNEGVYLEINGAYTSSGESFNYNNLKYHKNGDNIYLDGTIVEKIDFNVDIYKYNKIEEIIKKSDLIEEISYNDNTMKSTYKIGVLNYFNVLGIDSNCNEIDCANIYINIIVNKDKYINYVFIDYSNYYNYNVEINYTNINNIQKISIN